MARCVGMETTASFIATDKAMADVLASSDAMMVISGYPELTFTIATGQIPHLKNEAIEYSTPAGIKTESVSRNQTLQTLSIGSNERSDSLVSQTLHVIMTNGDNGNLEVEFYTGNGDIREFKHVGTLKYGMIKVEEGSEFDTEGTTSPMKMSYTLSGHYIPCNPTRIDGAATSAVESLAGLPRP